MGILHKGHWKFYIIMIVLYERPTCNIYLPYLIEYTSSTSFVIEDESVFSAYLKLARPQIRLDFVCLNQLWNAQFFKFKPFKSSHPIWVYKCQKCRFVKLFINKPADYKTEISFSFCVNECHVGWLNKSKEKMNSIKLFSSTQMTCNNFFWPLAMQIRSECDMNRVYQSCSTF